MELNKNEYNDYISRHMPRSRAGRNMLRAFVTGGAICMLGRLLNGLYRNMGLDGEASCTAVSVTLILFGALMTAVGVYDKAAKFGGAGTLVPITGFANAVVSPALDFKSEGLITGTAVKMFTIAGRVLAFGTAASVAYGVVLMLFGA